MEGGDFSKKEFKKTFELPKEVLADKLVSFVRTQGQLVIEIPLKKTSTHLDSDLFPKKTDAPGGGKMMSLNFRVPD